MDYYKFSKIFAWDYLKMARSIVAFYFTNYLHHLLGKLYEIYGLLINILGKLILFIFNNMLTISFYGYGRDWLKIEDDYLRALLKFN